MIWGWRGGSNHRDQNRNRDPMDFRRVDVFSPSSSAPPKELLRLRGLGVPGFAHVLERPMGGHWLLLRLLPSS